MIPESIESREKLNKYIEQYVTNLEEQDVLKEDNKNVKSLVKEELGKDVAKTFPKLVKARYQESKLRQVIKESEEALEQDAILKGE